MSADAVLGLGGGIDWEVCWDTSALNRLATELEIRAGELDRPGPIGSQRDLAVSILSHLRAGSGGEHHADTAVITEFASRFDYRATLGGTGVRAAIAMDTVGLPATVHLAAASPELLELLPPRTDHIAGGRLEHSEPHLIMQFPGGASVRLGTEDIVAPAANRLIYTGDSASQDFGLSPDLPDRLATARIFLISGFNAIPSGDVALRRADDLEAAMSRLPADATVIYEDAGFHHPGLSRVVRDRLARHVDIYSLNEDELAAYLGRRVDLLNSDDLSSALDELHTGVDVAAVILHTQHFAIAHGKNVKDLGPALDWGVAMASARYVHGDQLTREHLNALRATVPRRADVTKLLQALEERSGGCTAGVAAYAFGDVSEPTTIGLGDFFIGGVIAGILSDDAGEA
jgi:ADP-dependent phosphofructokinase/glucokinase